MTMMIRRLGLLQDTHASSGTPTSSSTVTTVTASQY